MVQSREFSHQKKLCINIGGIELLNTDFQDIDNKEDWELAELKYKYKYINRKNEFETEQESFWEGKFGDDYINRNNEEGIVELNINFFKLSLKKQMILKPV